MERLKFEEDMKKVLEGRTITPSLQSWDILEKKLEKKKKKPVRYFYKIGVAASISGILLVSSLYFKDTWSENISPLVDYKKEISTDNKKTTLVNSVNTEIIEASNDSVTTQASSKISATDTIDIERRKLVVNQTPDIIKEKVPSSKNKSSIPEAAIVIDSAEINQKIEAIALQLENFEKSNRQITDQQIDQLLLEAQREITAEHLLTSRKIDPSQLLSDVESELDETFKQRVLEILKNGVQRVRTVVAQRE